jgi:phosphoesterase family protein
VTTRSALAAFAAAVSLLAAPTGRHAAAEPDCRTFEPRPIARGTTATPRAAQRGAVWQPPRRFEHVLLVVLENQDYDTVVRHPYFRALARRGALFTHFNALFHPSYANYLALVGGKYFGTIKDDQKDIPRSERTIADLLEAKGLTWRQYAEGYPGRCFTGSSASGSRYQRKHVPFMSFESITRAPERCVQVVPAERFDRMQLPSFALYSPDMCHDGHDVCGSALEQVKGWIGSIPGAGRVGLANRQLDQAAEWLRGFLEPILADPAVMKDTLVAVTFDESADDANNHIYTVLLGGMVNAGAEIDACYDHYNLLRTVEDNFGVGTLGAEDERSVPIAGSMWRASPGPPGGR